MEATLVLIKPEAVAKSLTGNVLTKLSEAHLEMAACKCTGVSKELAEEHYKHLKGKPFFPDLVKYIMGELHKRKVVAMVYCGENAISKIRDLAGATNPEEADAESIRGKYGRITTKGIFENVIHASSDADEAEREIKLWFEPSEIMVALYPTEEKVISITKKMWL